MLCNPKYMCAYQKPLNSFTISICCLAVHTSSSSLAIISHKHLLCWDFTALPVYFIVAVILNSMLRSSMNTIYDSKDISWHQRGKLRYPLSSCIHFSSCHAQMLFVPLFIGMYLTVWQCCVCEQSCLCSSRQLTLVYRAEGGRSALLSLLLN